MEAQTRQRIEDYLDLHSGAIRTNDFQRAGLHNSYLATLADEAVSFD